MMDLKISFAYFYGETLHDAFLFAHTNDKWKRGEETTDYLAYFGFTSGLLHPNGKHKYPVYLNDMHYSELPKPTNDNAVSEYCEVLRTIIATLNEKGVTLTHMCVARILSNVCTISQHLLTNEVFWNVVDGMLQADLPPVNAFCVTGVDENRQYYMGLCLPYHVAGEHNINTTWPWNSSCQTGSGGGVRKTLHTLNRRPFFKDFDPNHLESLSTMLDGIYPHIVI